MGKKLKELDWRRLSLVSLFIIASAIVRTFSLQLFVVPNKLAPGGISGVASILNNINPSLFPVGVTILMVNLPLMALSFFFINKKFAILTSIETVITTIFVDLLYPVLCAGFTPFTDDLFFAAIMGGVLTGTGVSLVLRTGGSTGGTDILGMFARKKFTSTNVAWLIFSFDALITVVGGLVNQDLRLVVYSFVALFIGSKTNQIMLNGIASAIAVYIITEKKDEVVAAIFSSLRRGVTAIKVTGTYTNDDKTMLLILLKHRQIGPMRQLVKGVDPKAFMFASSVSEVIGRGFQPRDL